MKAGSVCGHFADRSAKELAQRVQMIRFVELISRNAEKSLRKMEIKYRRTAWWGLIKGELCVKII